MKNQRQISPQFSINVAAVSETEANIELNGFIDFFAWEGMSESSSSFNQKFKEAEAKYDRINIRIGACYGGLVYEGLPIYDIIASSKKEVHTYVTGIAASMGAIIFLAGHQRHMSEVSQLMIHAPSDYGMGNAKQLREAADNLQKVEDILGLIISKNTSEPADVISGWMSKDTWFTATDAQAVGLTDTIEMYAGRNINKNATAKMTVTEAFAYYNKALNPQSSSVDFIKYLKEKAGRMAASLFNLNKLNPQSMLELTLQDGTAVFIDSENTSPEIGDMIYSDAELATTLEDGEYTFGGDYEGYTATITEGAIATWAEAVVENAVDPVDPANDAAAILAAKDAEIVALKAQLAQAKKPQHTAMHSANGGIGGQAKPKLSANEAAAAAHKEKLLARYPVKK